MFIRKFYYPGMNMGICIIKITYFSEYVLNAYSSMGELCGGCAHLIVTTIERR
ncbi:MAG: hypothetical protein DESF_01362 [Desulfovibrio sp.]